MCSVATILLNRPIQTTYVDFILKNGIPADTKSSSANSKPGAVSSLKQVISLRPTNGAKPKFVKCNLRFSSALESSKCLLETNLASSVKPRNIFLSKQSYIQGGRRRRGGGGAGGA